MRLFGAIVLILVVVIAAGFVIIQRERVLSHLRSFFTEPDDAVNLAMLRIFFFGFVLASRPASDASRYAALPEDLIVPPRWIGWLVDLVPPDPGTVEMLRTIMLIAACLGFLGILSRWSSALFALTAFYVLLIPELYGKVDHIHHILWVGVILALSPCGDALSVDGLVRKQLGLRGRPASHVAYGMPLRTTWVMVGLIYFFPGFYKLISGGFEWIFSDNLRLQAQAVWVSHGKLPTIRIDRLPEPVLWGAAGATIVFELGFLFAVLFKRTRALAALVGFSFHVIAGLTLGIPFMSLRVVYAAFVPWASVFRWIRQLGGGGARVPDASEGLREFSGLRLSGALMVGLLYVISLAGVINELDGWPVAGYPTFPLLHGDEMVVVEVVLETSGGDLALSDSDSELAGWMPSYKMFPMLYLAAEHVDDPSFDQVAFWEAFTCGLASEPHRIRMDRSVVSTDPARSDLRRGRTEIAGFLPPTSRESRSEYCPSIEAPP